MPTTQELVQEITALFVARNKIGVELVEGFIFTEGFASRHVKAGATWTRGPRCSTRLGTAPLPHKNLLLVVPLLHFSVREAFITKGFKYIITRRNRKVALKKK